MIKNESGYNLNLYMWKHIAVPKPTSRTLMQGVMSLLPNYESAMIAFKPRYSRG